MKDPHPTDERDPNHNGNPEQFEPPDLERPASLAPTERQLEDESPGGHDVRGHDPYAALRYPSYVMYAAGWMISVIGRQVQDVSVGYELYSRTGSKLALGWVGLSQALPLLLLALPSGQLADRFDRRWLMIISQIFWAASSLGLAIVSHYQGPIPLVYFLLVTGTIAHATGWPARAAMLPQVVPAEIFNNAVTWNSSFFQIASVVGPAIAGLILLWGAPAAYMIDVACAIVPVTSRKYTSGMGPCMCETIASPSDDAAQKSWLMIMSRRRSKRSASWPAGSARRSSGSACDKPTQPSASFDPVREYSSYPTATSCT